MTRIYHNFELWEERGMWRIVSKNEFEKFSEVAAELMRDPQKFEAAMKLVADTWIYSCEHNLTDRSQNRRAWLGHAGCYLASNSPEDATRSGWWKLTQEQRDAADQAAENVILWWERNHAKTIFG